MTDHGAADPSRGILEMMEDVLRRSRIREPGSSAGDPLEDELAEEFFWNNWQEAEEELLSRTDKLRVSPLGLPPPRSFAFEYDRGYVRQAERGGRCVTDSHGVNTERAERAAVERRLEQKRAGQRADLPPRRERRKGGGVPRMRSAQ